jgi:hypothetical protein
MYLRLSKVVFLITNAAILFLFPTPHNNKLFIDVFILLIKDLWLSFVSLVGCSNLNKAWVRSLVDLLFWV